MIQGPEEKGHEYRRYANGASGRATLAVTGGEAVYLKKKKNNLPSHNCNYNDMIIMV